MKEQLKRILEKDRQYNAGDMAVEVFGFRRNVHYDVLVVAPGWKPARIFQNTDCQITPMREGAYTSGYELTLGDTLIAWMQCASGGCNLIDHLTICADLDFDKLIFLGAVGGLKKGMNVGDVCVPIMCIEGTMANAYLTGNIAAWKPFGVVTPNDPVFLDQIISLADFPIKKASVYCTDSISCEYYHLDFIKSFDTDLIEMETSSFYRMAELMEAKAAALLVVSDNSANGEPLLGMEEAQQEKYNFGRKVLIPRLLEKIARL